jgi:hypothetical protein
MSENIMSNEEYLVQSREWMSENGYEEFQVDKEEDTGREYINVMDFDGGETGRVIYLDEVIKE